MCSVFRKALKFLSPVKGCFLSATPSQSYPVIPAGGLEGLHAGQITRRLLTWPKTFSYTISQVTPLALFYLWIKWCEWWLVSSVWIEGMWIDSKYKEVPGTFGGHSWGSEKWCFLEIRGRYGAFSCNGNHRLETPDLTSWCWHSVESFLISPQTSVQLSLQ